MAAIEILAYTPKYMNELLKFVKDGKRKANGDYETDPLGRKMTGVIKWLTGRGVTEAHFFNSKKGEELQLFFSTVRKPEVYERPWMEEIPGFGNMVTTDGLVGGTEAFKPIADYLSLVQSNAELDKAFEDEKKRVAEGVAMVKEAGDAFRFDETDIMAALRGELGTDPNAVFAEIEKLFRVKL